MQHSTSIRYIHMQTIGTIRKGVTGPMGDKPFRWDLLEGAKGVQLDELGYRAAGDRSWVDVPKLHPVGAP